MSDDIIHRFSFTEAPIRGQWIRLSATLDTVFGNRPYPRPIQTLLAELLAAAGLMADGIKFAGAVALQTRGQGPVTTLLAECRERHLLRGIARWNEETDAHALAAAATDPASLLGAGHLAVTLLPEDDGTADPGYQGVVALEADGIASTLEGYFTNSEQLPTRLQLAFDGKQVTGLLLQRLPADPRANEHERSLHGARWDEALLLAATLTDAELSTWSVQELLHKLFHEHTLTLQPPRALVFSCTCSRERAERMLAALPREEIIELLAERGEVDVTCEICGARYVYDQIDTHALYAPDPPRLH